MTTNGTQTTNATIGYASSPVSGGIYNVTVTLTSTQTVSASFLVDSSNDTVLSVNFFGHLMSGPEAAQEFDSFMSLFGLEYTFGGAIQVYTDPAYFHSTGSSTMTFGTTTFQVTTWQANTLPLSVDECGVTSTISAYTLQVGTPPGTSLPFITYLHIETTAPSSEDITFQLVSMTSG